jgi:hypothetical protein
MRVIRNHAKEVPTSNEHVNEKGKQLSPVLQKSLLSKGKGK